MAHDDIKAALKERIKEIAGYLAETQQEKEHLQRRRDEIDESQHRADREQQLAQMALDALSADDPQPAPPNLLKHSDFARSAMSTMHTTEATENRGQNVKGSY